MKRERILQTVNEFPKEVDLNKLFERLLIVEKIEKGLIEEAEGSTVAHEKVKSYFKKKWQE